MNETFKFLGQVVILILVLFILVYIVMKFAKGKQPQAEKIEPVLDPDKYEYIGSADPFDWGNAVWQET